MMQSTLFLVSSTPEYKSLHHSSLQKQFSPPLPQHPTKNIAYAAMFFYERLSRLGRISRSLKKVVLNPDVYRGNVFYMSSAPLRDPNMKAAIFPLWLRIGTWVSFGGFILVVLFQVTASFSLLPTLGHLTIEKGGQSQTYTFYDLSCKRVAEGTIILFYDQNDQRERKIELRGGDSTGDGILVGSGIYIDSRYLRQEDCTRRQVMTARHGGGKSPKVGEYKISLDCTTSNERIRADLHSYSCSGYW